MPARSSEAPAAAGGPRLRLPLAIVGGVVLAAVAAVAAIVPWLCSDPARLARLVARAAPHLEADVTIGRARVGWLGPIVIEDVRVVPRSGARPPLSIGRIEGSHGLAALLLSRGDLGRLRVTGLEADLVFAADRTSNLTGLVAPADSSRRPRDSARGPRSSPLRMRLEIDDAVATVAGPWAPEPWVSDPTDVSATLGPTPDGRASAWTIDGVQLLREAKLEANVAQGVLAYIAPVLADATRTSGRFSLRLDGATFPVGAPEEARLAGALVMHEVDMGPGPLVAGMLGAIPGRLQPPRSIRVADDSEVRFRLADRRVWHEGLEFGLPLATPGQRLDIRSSGSVGLDDKTLDLKFELPLPTDLPADRPLLAALAGKSISIGVGGVLGKPEVNFDGSIRAAVGDTVADLVDRLRERDAPGQPRRPPADKPNGAVSKPDGAVSKPDGAGAKPDGGNGSPTAGEIIDLVGGLLDEVARRRAARAAADAGAPPAGEPAGERRGGRLLRRLAQPPAAEPESAGGR